VGGQSDPRMHPKKPKDKTQEVSRTAYEKPVRGRSVRAVKMGSAIRLRVPAVTADRAWSRLKVGVKVEAIR
jgi:PIN domain nuclease of toxin-antitoxin system